MLIGETVTGRLRSSSRVPLRSVLATSHTGGWIIADVVIVAVPVLVSNAAVVAPDPIALLRSRTLRCR